MPRPEESLRNKILNHFPAELSPLLVEFMKHISTLDVDVLIFMARKALRLYDLLLLAGLPASERPVYSHHILQQNLQFLNGKRIALIDDTLIVGTTLSRAVRDLRAAGFKGVTCHVFCLDKDNWCADLIEPARVFARLSSDEMLTFCAAEVTALASVAIPYLSDFPVSKSIRISRPEFDLLHSIPGWETFSLSTPNQIEAGAQVYTVLPSADTMDSFQKESIGGLEDIIDISKVRLFARHTRVGYWVRAVPIVTMRPMEENQVARLFSAIVGNVSPSMGNGRAALTQELLGPLSKVRFVQYVLSTILFSRFTADLGQVLNDRKRLELDLNEATRHFGRSLTERMRELHGIAFDPKNVARLVKLPTDFAVREAALPGTVTRDVQAEVDMYTAPASAKHRYRARTVLTDLTRSFVGLYKHYELPARDEVRKLGRRLFDAPVDSSPNRDRLQYGFAWRALAQWLFDQAGLRLTQRRVNYLSLLLDHLIDLGIAVPTLISREGVVFRGYRHGEDVLFGEQELLLAYQCVKGFNEGAESDTIPRVYLEKLVVTLLRLGIAQDFITVIHGVTGADGVARIGYHLHGAIPFMPSDGEDTYFADDKESWLSRYMQDRGVLHSLPSRRYQIGEPPLAALKRRGADRSAYQFGWLIGQLSRARDIDGKTVLTGDDFALVATCVAPKDVASALAAELRLVLQWYERRAEPRLRLIISESGTAANEMLERFPTSYGYVALNSALKKFDFYRNRSFKDIIDCCATYLKSLPNGDFITQSFLSDWDAILATDTEEQRARFDPWIRSLSKMLLSLTLAVFSIEIGLAALASEGGGEQRKQLLERYNKIERYLAWAAALVEIEGHPKKVCERMLRLVRVGEPATDPKKTILFGLDQFSHQRSQARALVDQVHAVIKDFGRTGRRTNFRCVMWYDIIDSKGKRSGLTGDALRVYRQRVRSFKDNVIRDVIGLCRDASRQDATIYPWQGQLNSKDDERHLFVTGSRSIGWLIKACEIVTARALSSGVAIRAIAITADFAGIPAYRYDGEPGVEGEAFWEHLSIIKESLKNEERSRNWNVAGRAPSNSILWVCGELVNNLALEGQIALSKTADTVVASEIDDLRIETRALGGVASC